MNSNAVLDKDEVSTLALEKLLVLFSFRLVLTREMSIAWRSIAMVPAVAD